MGKHCTSLVNRWSKKTCTCQYIHLEDNIRGGAYLREGSRLDGDFLGLKGDVKLVDTFEVVQGLGDSAAAAAAGHGNVVLVLLFDMYDRKESQSKM